MTSSFTDLGNIGTGKSNGISDENNRNNARRAFLNGTMGPRQSKPMELGSPLGDYLRMRAIEESAKWPEINPPGYEEELHREAA